MSKKLENEKILNNEIIKIEKDINNTTKEDINNEKEIGKFFEIKIDLSINKEKCVS
jgi:hypothetical protein